jgi:hypothetical protein
MSPMDNTAAVTAMNPHMSLSAGAVPPSTFGAWPLHFQYTKNDENYGEW